MYDERYYLFNDWGTYIRHALFPLDPCTTCMDEDIVKKMSIIALQEDTTNSIRATMKIALLEYIITHKETTRENKNPIPTPLTIQTKVLGRLF